MIDVKAEIGAGSDICLISGHFRLFDLIVIPLERSRCFAIVERKRTCLLPADKELLD